MPTPFILAQDPSAWAWVFNQGFAAGLLLLVGFGLYRFLCWSAKEFAVPMRDAAIEHLHETTGAMKELRATLNLQREDFDHVHKKLQIIDERTQKMFDSWKE
jgi:hypothetical protein